MRKFIISIAAIIVTLFVAAIIFMALTRQKDTTKPVPVGTSTYPQFDIMSGELSSNDIPLIIGDANIYLGKSLSSHDFSIRKDSYTKKYDTSGGYTLSMLLDTRVPASTYAVSIDHTSDSSDDTITFACAPVNQQMPNVTCVNNHSEEDG